MFRGRAANLASRRSSFRRLPSGEVQYCPAGRYPAVAPACRVFFICTSLSLYAPRLLGLPRFRPLLRQCPSPPLLAPTLPPSPQWVGSACLYGACGVLRYRHECNLMNSLAARSSHSLPYGAGSVSGTRRARWRACPGAKAGHVTSCVRSEQQPHHHRPTCIPAAGLRVTGCVRQVVQKGVHG